MMQQHITQIYIDIPCFTFVYVTERLFQVYIHIFGISTFTLKLVK